MKPSLTKKNTKNVVTIQLADVSLEGILGIPEGAEGLVLFAHGSGSSRLSPRNNYVADVLRQAGIGTFLFDLLTEREDRDYSTRFNIPLLTERLAGTTRWLIAELSPKHFSIGYFGASTGAAAALEAAATLPGEVKAIVSRGGRPDMALQFLPSVKAPTLLIVGEKDFQVIELNRIAYDRLTGTK
ncbi:MAG TPA: alpha/beta hydrolase, partial [Nitrospiria bacterium]|nr:alpha/beta hydrolase [Nitrospiria bacterium]